MATMGILMITAQILAILITPIFKSAGVQAFENPEKVENVFFYLVMILVFTAVVLVLAKRKGGAKLIKLFITGAIFMTMTFAFYPLISMAVPADDSGSPDWWERDAQTDLIAVSVLDGTVYAGGVDGILYTFTPDEYDVDNASAALVGPVRSIAFTDLDGDGEAEIAVLADNLTILDSDLQPWGPTAAGAWSDVSAITVTASGQGLYLAREKAGIWEMNASGVLNISDINDCVDMAVGSYVGDGSTELFLANASGVFVLNDNDFSQEDFLALSGANHIALGQIDGMGTIDVVVATETGDVVVFLNTDAIPREAKSFNQPISGLAVTDALYYDGDEILVTSGRQVNMLGWIPASDDFFASQEAGWWRWNITAQIGALENPATDMAFVDLDGDGNLEMVVAGGSQINIEAIGYGKESTFVDEVTESLSDIPFLLAVALSTLLTILLYKFPEWYVVDGVGLLVAAGATVVIGISLAILPVLVLLIALAIYDAISVYKTKHMIDLADTVMDMNVPILLVVPKKKNYSFIKKKGLKEQLESKEERDAMFMGLGDIVIPSVLIVSSITFLESTAVWGIPGNLLVGIGTMIGIVAGFSALMYFVAKGNPQAGLPLLNSGAIGGYLLTYLLVFGNLGFGIVLG